MFDTTGLEMYIHYLEQNNIEMKNVKKTFLILVYMFWGFFDFTVCFQLDKIHQLLDDKNLGYKKLQIVQ